MSPDPTHFKQMISQQCHADDPFGEEIGFDDPHSVPNGIFDVCFFLNYNAFFSAVSVFICVGLSLHNICEGFKIGVLVLQDQDIRSGNMYTVDDRI